MISIPDFYRNRDVLISGGTGFMGQVLIEKLLRSCSDINAVYVMMRSKKGRSAQERLNLMKNIKLFDTIKKIDPSLLNKIVAVEGDVKSIGLDFSVETKKKLQNVSIIYHLAASVRFDDPLKEAILLNTRGTHEMIKFALGLSRLDAFVHVSTTYCNPDKINIEEKIYPPHGHWKEVIKIAECLDQETLDVFMPKFTDYMPNTYTYTKGLAEQICNDYKNQLPIVVFRPSIVIGTEKEPVVGWCDNFNGPVGLLVACGFGILRTMYASGEEVLDCITADIAIKALIVSSWVCATKNQSDHQDEKLSIYNCSSLHSVKLNFLIGRGKEIMKNVPFRDYLWVADGGVTKCKFMNYFRMTFFQILPALLVDQVFCRIRGQKPFLMKIQRRITHAIVALRVFVLKEWHIKNTNFLELNNELISEDWDAFNMKRTITSNWELFTELIVGSRKYLLNETDEDLPQQVAKYRRRLIIHNIVKYTAIALIIFMIFTKVMKVLAII